jgi:hypothetical protein
MGSKRGRTDVRERKNVVEVERFDSAGREGGWVVVWEDVWIADSALS